MVLLVFLFLQTSFILFYYMRRKNIKWLFGVWKLCIAFFISTNAVTVLILCSARRAKRYQRAQLAHCHQVTVTAMAWSVQLVLVGTVLLNGSNLVSKQFTATETQKNYFQCERRTGILYYISTSSFQVHFMCSVCFFLSFLHLHFFSLLFFLFFGRQYLQNERSKKELISYIIGIYIC